MGSPTRMAATGQGATQAPQPVQELEVDLGPGHTAGHGAKADGVHGAAVAAGLADDAGGGEAGLADPGRHGPWRRGPVEHGCRADLGAGAAERALAAGEIDLGQAALAAKQNPLGASPAAGITPRAQLAELVEPRPGRPDRGPLRVQSAREQRTPRPCRESAREHGHQRRRCRVTMPVGPEGRPQADTSRPGSRSRRPPSRPGQAPARP